MNNTLTKQQALELLETSEIEIKVLSTTDFGVDISEEYRGTHAINKNTMLTVMSCTIRSREPKFRGIEFHTTTEFFHWEGNEEFANEGETETRYVGISHITDEQEERVELIELNDETKPHYTDLIEYASESEIRIGDIDYRADNFIELERSETNNATYTKLSLEKDPNITLAPVVFNGEHVAHGTSRTPLLEQDWSTLDLYVATNGECLLHEQINSLVRHQLDFKIVHRFATLNDAINYLRNDAKNELKNPQAITELLADLE